MTGQPPVIESYLTGLGEPDRQRLFYLLLVAELERRQRHDERPEPGEYYERFREYAGPIEAAFQEISPSAKLTDGNQSAPAAGISVRYFGDYEVFNKLGRGGMGIVYRARQVSLDRPVALKVLTSGLFADAAKRRRFQSEAEAVAQLDHPSIVPVYEVGEHDGQPYLCIKLIDGSNLEERLKKRPDYYRDNPPAAAGLIATVAAAIHHAHLRGILHRDLKPANILIDEQNRPHVTDFGLAKRIGADSPLTQEGDLLGTPRFMAPEQAWGHHREVTTLSDVYGLGATLYALLTGRAPFEGGSIPEILNRVRESTPAAPSKINPRSPRDLETICLKCLEKEPARRYGTAAALADDLNRYLAGEPILARPVGSLQRAWMWCRRNKVISALGAILIVLTVLSVTSALWARNESRRASQEATQAKAQTELAGQRLYDIRMNLVQRYWEDCNGELLHQGLDEQRPTNQGGIDRRGFEWFYWRRKASGRLTLKGHTNAVKTLAFSPDSSRLASAGEDKVVKVWDITTGCESLALKGHTSSVLCMAFSLDGRWLASGDWDGKVKVWDIATGHEFFTFRGDTSYPSCLTFSPDGKRLASADSGGTVKLKVWEAATGHEFFTIPGHNGDVVSVKFSPDGTLLAGAHRDGTVKVWKAATGHESFTIEGHPDGVASVAFSPDGKWLAFDASEGVVNLWDTATGYKAHTFKTRPSSGSIVTFSPDGSRLFSTNGDDVKVYDISTWREVLTLKGQNNPRIASDEVVDSVALSPDGKWLASAGRDKMVRVWDIATGQESLSLNQHITGAAFSPDDKHLVCAHEDGTVKRWDLATGRDFSNLKGQVDHFRSVAFSQDCQWLAFPGPDGTITLWNASIGRDYRTFTGHSESVTALAFSPDGRRMASGGWDRKVKVWDLVTGREIFTLEENTDRVANVAPGPLVYGWTDDLDPLPPWGTVASVAFSRDGTRLVSVGSDGMVKIWDAATGREALTFKGHTDDAVSVQFSPDGNQFASAHQDGTVKLWDAKTGQGVLTLKGHTAGVKCVAFSPDGKRLASAGRDTTVKVWDTAMGLETLTLRGHTEVVRWVAFSRDGGRLASTDSGGTVKVWDARPMDGDSILQH